MIVTADHLAVARWGRLLDEFEQRIIAQEAMIELAADGRLPDPDEVLALAVFTPPDGMPALPESLADRVRELLARNDLVQDRLCNTIATGRPARSLRRLPPRRPPRGTTGLDVRA